MNIKTVVTIATIGAAIAHDVYAKYHNKKLLESLRGSVIEIIKESKDEYIKNDGKRLLIRGDYSYVSDSTKLREYREYIINNAL